MSDYVIEFERLYNKIKAWDTILPDGILAYKLFNNTNISDNHEKLVRAKMTNIS